MVDAWLKELPIDGSVFFAIADFETDDGIVSDESAIYHYTTEELAIEGAKERCEDNGGSFIMFECKAVKRIDEKKSLLVSPIKRARASKEEE